MSRPPVSGEPCCNGCRPCEGNGFPCTYDPSEDTCCSSCACHPDCPPVSGEPRPDLSDADKLRLLAAWFDMWDATRHEDRQRILDDEDNPGKNDVQRDLRRIAAEVEARAEQSDV